MKNKILFTVLLVFPFLISEAQIDTAEALEAFEYLNRVRENPDLFSVELGVDLSKVKSLQKLVWNDTLAKVAEEKVRDMAKKNYFGHVNPEGRGINIMIHEAGYSLNPAWITNKSDNFFESLAAGNESGVNSVINLIKDEGVKGYGHRKHLLGMQEFYSNLTDVGIAFLWSENSPYISYTCVIIAKHDW